MTDDGSQDKPLTPACPHCGGKQGYYYKAVKHYQQYVDWSGERFYADDGESDLGRGYRAKSARCLDCDHRFSLTEVNDLVATDGEVK